MPVRISTKDKILELLKKETRLTVSELAAQLTITEMAVRKHLSALEKDHLLTSQEVRKPMGRPLQVYSLSPRAASCFPNNYEQLSIDFLRDLKELHGDEAIDYLLEKRSERINHQYASYMAGKTPGDKLEQLQKLQAAKGYMAEVQQVDDAIFELIEYNCPIFSVAKEFKKACACETNMFKKVLGTDLIERITCKADADDHCRFLIRF